MLTSRRGFLSMLAAAVAGASLDPERLLVRGFTASAALRLKAGDVFTIGTVYRVNPQSRDSTGALQQFTVLADALGSGAQVAFTSPA